MFASISELPRKLTPVYKAALFAALWAPVSVHAADEGAATRDEVALEEVVVTALKRDTKLQDTPVSITALNERTIERMAASNLVDIIRSVPSLQLSGDYGQRIVLRGVQAAGEPVVGLYYGETPLVGPSGSSADAGLHTPDLNLFDIERVEVLRGPQGTLYGAGSVGGTLRLLFNQPNATRYEGKVESQVSTTEGGDVGWYTKVATNVPLIEETLAARLVLYKQDRGGFTDDTLYGRHNVNGSDAEGGRLIVAWTPTRDITASVTAVIQQMEREDGGRWSQQYGSSDFDSRNLSIQPFEDELHMYNAKLDWELGLGTVTATSSYYEWDLTRIIDPNRAIDNILNNPAAPFAAIRASRCTGFYALGTGQSCSPQQIAGFNGFLQSAQPIVWHQLPSVRSRNHELRLTSRNDSRLLWTLGAYYEDRDDIHDHSIVPVSRTSGSPQPSQVLGAYYIGNELKQLAFFGDFSYKITDALTATVGARRYDYDKTTSGATTQYNFVTGAAPAAETQVDSDDSGVVKKYNLSYQATRNVLAYVQAAEGFRPGGANNVASLNASLIAYSPDRLWSYEGGLKVSTANGRYSANAAVFQIDWEDMQANLILGTATAIVTNAGAARIRGVELETFAQIFDNFSLSLGGTYSDGKLTEDQATVLVPLAGAAGQDGDKIPNSPKYTGTLSADYQHPLGSTLSAIVHADATYRSSTGSQFRESSPTFAKVDSSTVLNLQGGLEGSSWGAYLFVRNVFNEVAPQSAQRTAASYSYPAEVTLVSEPPRTIGFTVRKSFE